MKDNSFLHNTGFDEYADDYDAALAQGLSVSGEDRNYFARGRIAWLEKCLRQLRAQPRSVLDFGCGTGVGVPFFRDLINVPFVLGLDTSEKSLDKAQRTYGSDHAQFLLVSQYCANEQSDLVFCNGVFHHVPPDERAAVVDLIYRSLQPGGLFAFWENNPWNPGTRYVMSRIPFDRDAITLTSTAARHLLRAGGFEILRTDYMFIFPRVLSWLRSIELLLFRLPFGAQYQVLCRKPSKSTSEEIRRSSLPRPAQA